MRRVLDAGAFLALERRNPFVWELLGASISQGDPVVTHGGVVGQVWRGRGPRQALLSRALASVEVVPLDETLGRAAGELLTASGGRDVIDAALVLLAHDGDQIVTSDPTDIDALVAAVGRAIEIVIA